MSACCDGRLADDCPCECHAWRPIGMDAVMDPDELLEWWQEARVAIEANLAQLVARDIFGVDRVPDHPLLDPERPVPAVVEPVPPVDLAKVVYPRDRVQEVTLFGRVIGWTEGEGLVHITDPDVYRALQAGAPLAVSINRPPAPDWAAVDGWLADPGRG